MGFFRALALSPFFPLREGRGFFLPGFYPEAPDLRCGRFRPAEECKVPVSTAGRPVGGVGGPNRVVTAGKTDNACAPAMASVPTQALASETVKDYQKSALLLLPGAAGAFRQARRAVNFLNSSAGYDRSLFPRQRAGRSHSMRRSAIRKARLAFAGSGPNPR